MTAIASDAPFDMQGDATEDQRVGRAMRAFATDFGRTAATYMEACIHCGACAKACHFYTATEDPKYTPILKIEPFKQAYKREAGPLAFVFKTLGLKPKVTLAELQEWQELIYDSCTMCGRCTLICPMSIDIAALVRMARHGMNAAGLAPQELRDRTDAQARGALPGAGAAEFAARVAALSAEHGVPMPLDKPKADVLLCASQAELTQYADAMVANARILNRMGVDWTYDSAGFETSNWGIVTGDEAWQREASARIVAAAERIGAHTVVLPECGHDYQALRWEAANALERPLPFKVLHIVEMMAEGVRSGALKLRSIDKTVAFHDPCQVSRRGGAQEAPRVVMAALGLELKVIAEPEELNWCCGGGGGVIDIRRADALRLKAFEIKKRQLDGAGAEILATSCASCRRQFDDGGRQLKWDRTVESLVVLTAANLVEE